MQCPACHVEVIEDAKFCHRCGAVLQTEETDATPPTPTTTAAERFHQTVADRQNDDDDDERELWAGSYSRKAMFGTWVIAGLTSIAAIIAAIMIGFGWTGWLWTIGLVILMWLGLYLRLLYRQLSVHYLLTNQRLIHKKGLLNRTTDRIETIDMDDVTFSQGPIQRILGVGTIKITSSDKTHPEIILLGIDQVAEVSRMMDDARRTERRRRGLHIESV